MVLRCYVSEHGVSEVAPNSNKVNETNGDGASVPSPSFSGSSSHSKTLSARLTPPQLDLLDVIYRTEPQGLMVLCPYVKRSTRRALENRGCVSLARDAFGFGRLHLTPQGYSFFEAEVLS